MNPQRERSSKGKILKIIKRKDSHEETFSRAYKERSSRSSRSSRGKILKLLKRKDLYSKILKILTLIQFVFLRGDTALC